VPIFYPKRPIDNAIRRFTWQNYYGSEIRVEKSVWRSHEDEPKSRKSKGAIPVIAQLKLLLDEHWEKCGRPRKGFIFSNKLGNPMNLEALAVDVIRPALERANLAWHGWHAFRRGLATNLHRLRVFDKVIQQILRQANVTTTMNIYVTTLSVDAANAMKTLETMCATTMQPERLGSTRIMQKVFWQEVGKSRRWMQSEEIWRRGGIVAPTVELDSGMIFA
jgi:hypothetical protein